MRSRVTVSTPNYDRGDIIIDAGLDKGAVERDAFFAFCDSADDRILSLWRVKEVKFSISILEPVWRSAVEVMRPERGSTLKRMDVVEASIRRGGQRGRTQARPGA
jgi:hypothetical protein